MASEWPAEMLEKGGRESVKKRDWLTIQMPADSLKARMLGRKTSRSLGKSVQNSKGFPNRFGILVP